MDFSTAWLTTNRTCNNNCSWCYARNSLQSKTIMDLDNAQKLVDNLKKRNIKRIILIGGEPTIYPYFIDLIKYIRKENIRVSIATNGRKFSDISFASKVLDAGINGIDISLKAITEENYKRDTGSYGLKEMLDGYNNLKKLNFKPSMSYVIVDDNHNKFDDLVSFLLENNITDCSIQFVKPVLELDKTEKLLDLRDMGNFVEYIYNKLSYTNINYTIEVSFPLCLINKTILRKLSNENRIINCCHVPRGSGINFDENFKIIPCNHFVNFPFSESPIDFSDDESIDKIMSSKIVSDFREKSRCYPASKCQTCNLWSQCGGGCFTRWLTLDPNDYIK